MSLTKKSALTVSMLLVLGTTTVMADEMENKGIYAMSAAQIQLAESEMTAREHGAEAMARARGEEAEANRASEPNKNETRAREQAREREQKAREFSSQMEQQGRSMSMDRPSRMERPATPPQRPSRSFR